MRKCNFRDSKRLSRERGHLFCICADKGRFVLILRWGGVTAHEDLVSCAEFCSEVTASAVMWTGGMASHAATLCARVSWARACRKLPAVLGLSFLGTGLRLEVSGTTKQGMVCNLCPE